MDVALMFEIDGELDSSEVAGLKFLCRDHVPWKQLERVQDGRELFQRLEEQGLLEDDTLFVEELLLTIKRLDLLGSHLNTRGEEVESTIQRRGGSYAGISPYRKLLYELSEDVTDDNLSSLKFLSKLPRAKQGSCTSALDVLVEMEKREELGEDNVEPLAAVCEQFNKQLATRLREYAAQRAAGGDRRTPLPYQESSVHGYTDRSLTYPEMGPPSPPQQPRRLSSPEPRPMLSVPVSEEAQSLSIDAAPDTTPAPEEPDDTYSMNSRPRGYCLIINNFSFREAAKLQLKDRKGTDKDVESLTKVFSRLHFKVEERKDLRAEALLRAVEELGGRDHSALDAFVCCVLSHGEKGTVLGTDGREVRIRDITLPFTSSRCPSLARKPKLFFIQACQGQDMQRGYAPAGGGGREGVYEEDAGRIMPDAIPDDADFLLGMATVEDYKSFRNVTQGSIFIQELCRQLEDCCPRREDILTILTRVNHKVSSGVYLDHKQMPEPRYTLTKKLVLPLD
ncbi:hypothetical protein MATL_G00152860 [Megalops atlanticus]|uniref:Caspase-8 n=1 Tax=Megalops atlanticus TaxID=7932 RepID=A0A9D3T2F9_MEGAT|nr:hypothetical protein MATL_G00152860 [Megalops atlanticus]